jgi:hypothetical protein
LHFSLSLFLSFFLSFSFTCRRPFLLQTSAAVAVGCDCRSGSELILKMPQNLNFLNKCRRVGRQQLAAEPAESEAEANSEEHLPQFEFTPQLFSPLPPLSAKFVRLQSNSPAAGDFSLRRRRRKQKTFLRGKLCLSAAVYMHTNSVIYWR